MAPSCTLAARVENSLPPCARVSYGRVRVAELNLEIVEGPDAGRQAQRDVTRLHPPDGGHVKVVRPSEAAQANG